MTHVALGYVWGEREEGTHLEFKLNAQIMQRFLHHNTIINYRALTSSRKFSIAIIQS